MANSILTNQIITQESARVLHQKLNFVGNTNVQYDGQYAQTGGKIGASLNVRMPAKYKARKTATLSVQDHTERSTPLAVTSQYGVDVSFSSVDRTLSLDMFSDRIIAPAMAQLAAELEGDCIAEACKYVANYAGTTSTTMTYKSAMQLGQFMTEQLAPTTDRSLILTPQSRVEFQDAVKGLFQDQSSIAKQYRDGMMGRTGGFDVYENTLIGAQETGTLAGTPLTDGASLGTGVTNANTFVSQTTVQINGATSGTTLKAGDVITFGTVANGVVDCHPETKRTLGRLKKFVVQDDVTLTTAATSYAVTVKPGLIYGDGNAFQNCILTNANTDNMTVTKFGVAGTSYAQDLAFHKDAFLFATVDLEDVSGKGAKGARAVVDGISIRMAEQYNITDDRFVTRFDVLFGFAPLYPELASRHFSAL